MKKYKLVDVSVDGILELQDKQGGRKTTRPNQVLYLPESGLFVLKKDMAFKNKLKSLVSNAIALLLLILIFILLFLSINTEPSGYYKEKTYDDGTGIYYEWYEGGDK